MKFLNKKSNSGFTIIEVTIVLAIAGLIMAIVFVAVPALQRSAHNTQRKSDASHFAGLVNDYSSNHAGTLPSALCTTNCSANTAGQLDVSGEHWDLMSAPSTVKVLASTSDASYGSTTTMVLNESAECDPTSNAISYVSNSRSFAIGFEVETSGNPDNACVGQ